MRAIAVLALLFAIACSAAGFNQRPDQRTHWQLVIAAVNMETLKIVAEIPANRVDYTKDACFKAKDAAPTLDFSKGKKEEAFTYMFACIPLDKTDT